MRDWRTDLGEAVAGCAAELRFAEPMAKHTTFRVGGLADAWICVHDRQALERVLQVCRASGVRIWLLGRGSNVLVSDQGLRGVVVCLGGELAQIKGLGSGPKSLVPDPYSLSVGGGAGLDAIATFAEQAGLAGAEFLAGIPGTVGGGLHSNAGAFGRSLGDIVTGVTALDRDGNESVIAGAEIRREYRKPMIDRDLVVLDVTLQLQPATPDSLRDPSAAVGEAPDRTVGRLILQESGNRRRGTGRRGQADRAVRTEGQDHRRRPGLGEARQLHRQHRQGSVRGRVRTGPDCQGGGRGTDRDSAGGRGAVPAGTGRRQKSDART